MANTRKNFKKLIAIVVSLALIFNGIFVVASAASATPDLVQNFSDTYYKQDGSVGSESDWEIHLSKKASVTEQDNVYDINLQIQTKNTEMQFGGNKSGAVALVLDVSNSMATSAGENGTRLGNLKAAVYDFLDEYVKNANDGDKRLVSIAVFGTNAVTIQEWVDVTDAKKLAAVKTKVKLLSTGNGAYIGSEQLTRGGTNMEAGLVLGRNLLNQSKELTGISVENQSLILFSDGEPTARVKNVKDDSVDKVKYGGTDTGKRTDSYDYDDISEILSGVKAAKIAVKYGYEDTKKILKVPPFTRVITSSDASLSVDLTGEAGKVITSFTTASAVADPMGKGVTMIDAPAEYNASEKVWDLTKFTPTVADGITTYTISYKVQIDPEAVPADSDYPAYTILTPANGVTTLNYIFGEANTPVSANFNVPNIRGIIPFDVSYEYTGFVPAGAPSLPESATYKAGAAVDVAEAPVLENYTFSGWDKDDFTMPAEDVVIRGYWTENPKYDYTLIYNANFDKNEQKADSENIEGTYATAFDISVDENTFVRENYDFAGWNTKADGSGKSYAANDKVALTAENNSEVLYAQWTEHKKYDYSLTYNANFGAGETKADSENVKNTYATALNIGVDENTFVRENYTFAGWNTRADGKGKAYAAGEKVKLTAENNSEVLYAQWTENKKYDYSLTYDANFGAGETKADSENVKNTYATALNIGVDENTFVRKNYTFAGWNTKADGKGKAYAVGEAVKLTAENNSEVLYAQWIEDDKYSYSLIYNANFGLGETKADSENVVGVYDAAYSIEVDKNSFVRENYTFAGWNTEADGKGKAYAAGEAVKLTAENNSEVLYAQWTENAKYDYSLTYNANFGKNEEKADSENVKGIYATALNINVDENTFVRENYTFAGWNTEADGKGKAYAVGEAVKLTAENNSEVLYAQWIEDDKYSYSLIYNANFGLGETKADSENVVGVYDVNYNIAVDKNTFVRDNYDFAGWNTEADGSGKAYAVGETVALTAENNSEVLYAQWTEHAKYDYSLIYNANFGENEEKADSENVKGVYDTTYSITVDENTFVREDYTFIGWNTEADGSGKAYEVNSTVGLFANDNNEVLFAQWKENEKPPVEPPVDPVDPPVEPEDPPVEPEDPPAEEEEEIEIPDDPVPLDDYQVPQTGEASNLIFVITFVVSGLGIFAILMNKKREKC